MLFKKKKKYFEAIDHTGVFDNDRRSMLPQTTCAKLVREHFKNVKKTPKALIIGFDGARADSMNYLVEGNNTSLCGSNFVNEYSAINKLRNEGGLYLSYAGGEPGQSQETSTAQGWASILTGEWGDKNGVLKHVVLSKDCPTVLRELAEKGKKSVFYGIWPDHFTITYKGEMEIAEKENIPLRFIQLKNDKELEEKMLKEVKKDSDIIFGIFESPDLNGHGYGFGSAEYRYVLAISNLDRVSYKIIKALEDRPTYNEEDWLIIITSDHGGHKKGHGTQLDEDRTTFIASNKKAFGIK